VAGSTYVLDKAYTIDDAAGVGQYLCVVRGAADGGCKKPGGANAAGFCGITQEAQSKQNKGVAVRKLGISRAIASGAITQGDRVNIAGVSGKVQSCEATVTHAPGTAAVTEVIGVAETTSVNDGDTIYVFITPFPVNIAVS
jgi:hypothetical protein